MERTRQVVKQAVPGTVTIGHVQPEDLEQWPQPGQSVRTLVKAPDFYQSALKNKLFFRTS